MNDKNYFEAIKEDYAEEIVAIQPKFYENGARYINSVLKKVAEDSKVLDIGNGGVLNYDYSGIGELYCADLAISTRAVEKYKQNTNVHFVEGNMLDLKEWKDNTFDVVIVQTVIHHLAGKTFKQTEENVTQGINECMRVLKPGGNCLIIESTVKQWFEVTERMFYPMLQLFFRIIRFDTVYQYSYKNLLKKLINMNLCIEEDAPIEMDRYIWLCRKKILTKITPCGACWIKIKK